MKVLKFLGYAAGAFVLTAALAATTVYFASNAKLNRTHTVSPRVPTLTTDDAALARGAHIAKTRGCIDCHGADFGGNKVIEDGAMGRIHGTNLTRGRGSRVADYTDADWVRAIRHGVSPKGRPLFLMPSEEYATFTDGDLADLIAYLKTVPAVDRDHVPLELGPISRMLLATGKMRLSADAIDHANLRPTEVVKAVSVSYGAYLANGCIGCHGPNFSGGKIEIGPPDWPHARNLTPHASGNLANWTEADFVRALREARRPDGSEINPVMPRAFGGMDDTELKALYAFFKSLPAVETGAR